LEESVIIDLNFNSDEDTGLNLEGSVTLPNDMKVGGIDSLAIRGLADWRNVPADTIYVSKSFIDNTNFITRMKGKPVKWIGFKSRRGRWDILLPHALRVKGEKAVAEFLKKFFKAFSKQANIKIGLTEDSMEPGEVTEEMKNA
jgi:hypothetical protein